MSDRVPPALNRRRFAALGALAATAPALLAQTPAPATNAIPQNTSAAQPKQKGTQPGTPAFGEVIEFTSRPIAPRLRPFSLQQVRLLPSDFLTAQQADLAYMQRLPVNRLVYNFLANAGLPTTAAPFGGWEKPDCELRGHFTGHYLSGCALMYGATGDNSIKAKGDEIVSELARAQAKLSGGYLSAFPISYFDRLNSLGKVWAPFYTVHKIMAGLYDMHQLAGNQQALAVLTGMADWADAWTARLPEPHMQDVLNTEYGGMNDILYKLSVTTGDRRYAVAGDRFTKKWFFNPLAARRDELRGLHANTHIPQVIGAAQRYEISGDERFHDVADFFWYEITGARAYATGGTSNNEGWLTEPRRLAAELDQAVDTTECCCAYNMLKLTRHLYSWTADPRYMDYYERTLYNHRLGAIDPDKGHTQYYLSLTPGAWRTFNTEEASFWCCTGTGVEEFAQLGNSIYYNDGEALYVNLFIPSELDWREKGLRVRQETRFPDSPSTTLHIVAAPQARTPIHLRIPAWAGSGVVVKINGKTIDAASGPSSYLILARTWKPGDRIEMSLPMHLYTEPLPDRNNLQAMLYGPLVLAGDLGPESISEGQVSGPMGPKLPKQPHGFPALSGSLQPGNQALAFEGKSDGRSVRFQPFYRTARTRYSVYWDTTG